MSAAPVTSPWADLPLFDGVTYDPPRDAIRLGSQLHRVAMAMKPGGWMTLAEISRAAAAPEASVSARIRDLRKHKFGAHTVDVDEPDEGGTFRYRLTINPNAGIS